MRPVVFAVFLVLVACARAPDAQTPDSNGEAIPPFPCKTDAECSPPACGPCESGAPLLQQSPSCAVNPCPNVAVVCSRNICVVK
jgi:hypothetical protein